MGEVSFVSFNALGEIGYNYLKKQLGTEASGSTLP